MSAQRHGNLEDRGSLTRRFVHGTPRFLITVVVLVGAALLFDSGVAHAQAAYVDTPQVCTTSDLGTTVSQAHITQSCVGTTTDGSEIVFSLSLRRGSNPATWSAGTGATFDVSVDGATDSYVVGWTEALGAYVFADADPATTLCTPTTVYNAPNAYLIEVAPSCLGTPPAISWSAQFTYVNGFGVSSSDTSPATGLAGPVIFDGPATATFTNSTPPALTATDTSTFTETAPWQLAWTYNCTDLGAAGTFDVTVVSSPAASDAGVSATGTGGSATASYTNSGSFYLSVLGSGCDWNITVSPTPTPPPTTTTTPPTTTPPTTTTPTTSPPTSTPTTTPPSSPPPTGPTIPLTPVQVTTVDRASEHAHVTVDNAVVHASTSATTTTTTTTQPADPAASTSSTTTSTPPAIAATGAMGVIGGTATAHLGGLTSRNSGLSILPWLLVIPGLLVVGVPGFGVVRRRRKTVLDGAGWPNDAVLAQAAILAPAATAAVTATVAPAATRRRRQHVPIRRWLDLLDRRRMMIAGVVLIVVAVTAGAVVKWGFSSSVSPATAASGSGPLTRPTVPPASKFIVPADSIPSSRQAAPTAAEDAAVQGWWAINGTWTTILLDDEIAVKDNEFAPPLTTLFQANNLLEKNLALAVTIRPVPNATMEREWTNMLDDFQSAGSSVVDWIYTSDRETSGSWTQILTEFQRADGWAAAFDQEAPVFGVN